MSAFRNGPCKKGGWGREVGSPGIGKRRGGWAVGSGNTHDALNLNFDSIIVFTSSRLFFWLTESS
jgi:hypothetical protein